MYPALFLTSGIMKTILLPILLLLSRPSFAQFAIIADTDGFANIRNTAAPASRIVDTLHNGHFVYCFETNGNWINIDYSKKKKDLTAYVYHDRVKYVSSFEKIPALSSYDSVFVKDSIRITISTQPFVRTRYRLIYAKDAENAPKYIQSINGKQYWGTDGRMPATEYKSIHIIMGNKEFLLPKAATENLFEPSIGAAQVNYDKKNDVLYIQSSNSDGAGSYEVIWRIEKGSYTDRYIAYGF